jgi:general secretion pathway protein A
MLSPAQAGRGLWQLHSDAAMPLALCAGGEGDSAGRLRCVRDSALTWEPLQALAHPLVVELVTEARLRAAALLLELRASEAVLATAQGTARVPLSALAPHWTGRYHYLWTAPPEYQGVLREGQSGAAVSWVAQQFARLDRQPQALAAQRFSAALRRRVELFQRSQGLAADGLIGPQTLQRLNVALGEVPDGTQRWLQLLQQGEEASGGAAPAAVGPAGL